MRSACRGQIDTRRTGKMTLPPRSCRIGLPLSYSLGQHGFLLCSRFLGQLAAITRQQMIYHRCAAGPVEGAERVAGGDEARAGVKHFVLGVTRAELRADGVPCRLQ